MSIEPPKTDADYTPEHAEQLDKAVATVSDETLQAMVRATDTVKRQALASLVSALDSGFKIAIERYVEGKPEPYPGAAAAVMRQSREAIELARKSGLLS